MILSPQSAINSDKISSNFGILPYVQSHLYNCNIYNEVVPKVNFPHNFPTLCSISRGVRCLTPEGTKKDTEMQKPQTSRQEAEVNELTRVNRVWVQRDSERNHWTLIKWWKGILTEKKFMNHSFELYNRVSLWNFFFLEKTLLHCHWIKSYIFPIRILLT